MSSGEGNFVDVTNFALKMLIIAGKIENLKCMK